MDAATRLQHERRVRVGVGRGYLFDTRLVIYKGGYAGTWGGGATGGKMFGNIVKNVPK